MSAGFARRIQQSLAGHDGERIFVYFGQQAPQLSLIQEAYETAKEALLYKYVYDESGIVLHEEAAPQTLQYIGLEDSVRAGFWNRSRSISRSWRRQFITCSNPSGEVVCTRSGEDGNQPLRAGRGRVLGGMDGDQSRLSSLEPMTEWHDCNLSLQGLKRLFTEFAIEARTISRASQGAAQGRNPEDPGLYRGPLS